MSRPSRFFKDAAFTIQITKKKQKKILAENTPATIRSPAYAEIGGIELVTALLQVAESICYALEFPYLLLKGQSAKSAYSVGNTIITVLTAVLNFVKSACSFCLALLNVPGDIIRALQSNPESNSSEIEYSSDEDTNLNPL